MRTYLIADSMVGLCDDASLNKLAALMELMFLFVRLLMVVRTVDADDVVRSDVTGLDATLEVDEVRANREAAVRCCCPLFNGKLSCRMLAAGEVERPGSLPENSINSFIWISERVRLNSAWPLVLATVTSLSQVYSKVTV